MEEVFQIGVKALFLDDENKILVLNSNPKEFEFDFPNHWDIPGGRIQKGDSVTDTLERELFEELNLSKKDWEIIRLFDASRSKITVQDKNFKPLFLATFLCRLRIPIDKLKFSSEHLALCWVTIDEAKKLLNVKFSDEFVNKLDSLL